MNTYEPSKAAVEAGVNAVDAIIPNSGGVVWEYEHEDGQREPVTLAYAIRQALSAAGPVMLAEALAEVRELAEQWQVSDCGCEGCNAGRAAADDLRAALDALPGGEQAGGISVPWCSQPPCTESGRCAQHATLLSEPVPTVDREPLLAQVTCTVCDELIEPNTDASPDGDWWAHRDCAEAGE